MPHPRSRKKMLGLAADIGGTHARFELFEARRGWRDRKTLTRRSYRVAEHEGLTDVLEQFQQEAGPAPSQACFGLACSVGPGPCRLAKSSWLAHRSQLSAQLGHIPIQFLNDLEATAHIIPQLGQGRRCTLQPGPGEPEGTLAVLGAGTGLGESFLVYQEGRYRPQPSEGGRAPFVPRSRRDWGLYRYLCRQEESTSIGNLIAGPGLVKIYQYLSEIEAKNEPPEITQHIERAPHPAAAVAEAAQHGLSARAREARRIFLWHWGAEAARLALTVWATGGIYMVGNIARTMLTDPKARKLFIKGYREATHTTPELQDAPVFLVTQSHIGLLGVIAAMLAPTLSFRE